MNGYDDVEQPQPRYKRKDGNLPSINASLGWIFPEVKLASWDPENEKQWKVRTLVMNDGLGLVGIFRFRSRHPLLVSTDNSFSCYSSLLLTYHTQRNIECWVVYCTS